MTWCTCISISLCMCIWIYVCVFLDVWIKTIVLLYDNYAAEWRLCCCMHAKMYSYTYIIYTHSAIRIAWLSGISTLTKSNLGQGLQDTGRVLMDRSGIEPFHLCVRTGGLADALLPRKFDANFPVARYRMLRKAHNWIAHRIPGISGNELLTCMGIEPLTHCFLRYTDRVA